jgi:hypothetical protein
MTLNKKGYYILKSAINKSECQKLVKHIINNILHKQDIFTRNRNNKKIITIDSNNGKPLRSLNKWKPLFESEILNKFLNKNFKKWKYINGAKNGLGWIHIRRPYKSSKQNNKIEFNNWHIDSTDTNTITLLPYITQVKKNGGGTLVIEGTHKIMKNTICKKKSTIKEIDNLVIKSQKIKEITANQGDILIMDANLVHSLNIPKKNHQTRILFNLALSYKK